MTSVLGGNQGYRTQPNKGGTASPTKPAVEVRLLGPFRVLVHGRELVDDDWPRKKARQLFKCLLTRPQRRLLRDEAIELLWPGAGPTAGAASLRTTLSALRQTLQPADLVGADRDGVTLRSGADLWVDADAFEKLVGQARTADDPRSLLEQANSLYAGHYLPDDVYEGWATERRDHLKRTWTELQITLARLTEDAGDIDAAVVVLERMLRADPCQERVAPELMRLLAGQGRRPEALRVYQRLVQALQDELQVDPSARTIQLHDDIAAGEVDQEPAQERDSRRAEIAAVIPAPAILPTGTVTFLLTDVDGSTRIWEAEPNAMRQALIQHDSLIEKIVGQHAGVLVRTRGEGDSRLAVFTQATAAVATACALQVALHEQAWPTLAPVRVRIVLHTGEADVREGDYSGPAVNRCARLRDIAHGGQALLSRTTAALVRDQLPVGVALLRMGTYVLKDLVEPEAVFQLLHTDLPSHFPPLQSAGPRCGTIPPEVTPLIGRARELQVVREQLGRPDVRLLTLTGTGGVGKTRLAVAVAAELQQTFQDGAWFVDLSPLRDASLVVPTIAQTLYVRQAGGQPVLDLLIDYLRDWHVLLVIDNFEQVLEAAPQVTALLGSCPNVKVLATSREPLRLHWEHVRRLPPLRVPDLHGSIDLAQLAQVSAVALFVNRARFLDPEFHLTDANARDVAEICARLDGLPLALELAAARTSALPPHVLLRQLRQRRGLLHGARDAIARHMSLRAAIAWSYELLSASERALFRRFGVFTGGCRADAATAVCGIGTSEGELVELLAALGERNLLQQASDSDGELRYWMLETIRDFALEQLTVSGEEREVRSRYATYYLSMARKAAPELVGEELEVWLDRLELEIDNFRAIMDWSVADSEASDIGLGLCLALAGLWRLKNRLPEANTRLVALLAKANKPGPDRTRGLALAATIALFLGDVPRARWMADEAVTLARQLPNEPILVAVLNASATVAQGEGDHVAARALTQQGLELAHRVGDRELIATLLNNLGEVTRLEGDYARAAVLFEECRAFGHKGMLITPTNLGFVRLHMGDIVGGVASFLEGLDTYSHPRCQEFLGLCFAGLGYAAVLQGRLEPGARLLGAARELMQTSGTALEQADRVDVEAAIATARARMGERAFVSATDAGGRLTLDAAMAEARSVAQAINTSLSLSGMFAESTTRTPPAVLTSGSGRSPR